MTKVLIRLLTSVVALLVVARFIPGIEVDSMYTAVIAALILGLLNLLVRPILVILTLPITILTLGLFLLVINAGIFWFVSTFVDGFDVTGVLPALLGALCVSIVSAFGNKLLA